MIFGDMPVAEAEGCVLAHSLLVGGRKWAKGRVLAAADVAALHAAGFACVVAARLEPFDVGEDAAAARLAAAAAGPGLRLGAATTGRVNLRAEADGLLLVDAPAVHRLNAVTEAVTLATLPPWQPVTAGTIVATLKIIPFAVPEAAVAACTPAVPPLRVASWRGVTAGLVQTRVAGTKEGVLDKTAGATAHRLASCGGVLAAEERCAHRPDAVAAALRALRGRGCDLLLMVGASAITDRGDVLPVAVERAGGRVVHLGMPVDPGNLLMLGDWDGVAVLGLPGCARSPRLNGADWVLWRLAAGLAVGPADIMGMGVGGLVSDVPGRPMPRAKASP
ncbi:molybdopterin-binding protein [Novispirillum sp. DQ9]|uniref:molybdopterin-binding protein n=1 Tax=Novispirillum sp. DQ9 TaxID=3398612 RepID=UPI003C7D95EC